MLWFIPFLGYSEGLSPPASSLKSKIPSRIGHSLPQPAHISFEPCGPIPYDPQAGHLKKVPFSAVGVSPTAWLRANTLGESWHQSPVDCSRASILTSSSSGSLRLSIPSLKYETASCCWRVNRLSFSHLRTI